MNTTTFPTLTAAHQIQVKIIGDLSYGQGGEVAGWVGIASIAETLAPGMSLDAAKDWLRELFAMGLADFVTGYVRLTGRGADAYRSLPTEPDDEADAYVTERDGPYFSSDSFHEQLTEAEDRVAKYAEIVANLTDERKLFTRPFRDAVESLASAMQTYEGLIGRI